MRSIVAGSADQDEIGRGFGALIETFKSTQTY